jgi:hypothetical protein
MVDDGGMCPIPVVIDPNDMLGPIGYGTPNFVQGGELLPYRIDFENSPTATAPAQAVTITDQLAATLDWTTFQLTESAFGDTLLIIPPGSQHYQATVAMTYNGKTFNVLVEAGIHGDTRQVYATFQSIDPNTDLPPDVLTGFLPPEDGTGRGTGHLSFTIQPKAGLPTGTQIRNVADITFDENAPIATDQVSETDPSKGTDPTKEALVTIDAVAPTSSVAALPAVSSTNAVPVNWSGGDDAGGSGVASYTVYVSDEGGPFAPWLMMTTETSDTYVGQDGHTYAFYSVATDNAGNVQPTPAAAQAATTVDATPPTSSVAALPQRSPGTFAVSWSGSDANGIGIASYSVYVSDNGGAFTAWLTNTTLTTANYTGANGHTYGFYSVATDNLGNQQLPPSSAQASTTVDSVPPTSAVTALPAFSLPMFTVKWSGSDNTGGSGLATYDVFVSDNGAAFVPLLTATTLTSTTYSGVDGHTYGFYSVAADNVGNRQATPSAAQASTTVDGAPPTSTVAALPAFSPASFTVSWSGSDGGGSGIASYSVYVSDNGGAFTPWLTNTTQLSAAYAGTNGHTYGFYSTAIDNLGNQQSPPSSAQAGTTVDALPPSSSVAALPAITNTPSFTVSWSGRDNAGGSGLATFTISVSDNGGPFVPWLAATTLTSATYTGTAGHSYGFYSVATDHAGNVQPTPAGAQATTFVQHGPPSQPVDAGFESPSVGSGPSAFLYAPSGSAWTFSGDAGLAGNGSGFTAANGAAPQGNQVAFLQDTGSVSQSVTFAGGTCVVTLSAAQRGSYQASFQTIRVLVDGNTVGTITPAGSTYQTYSTASFGLTAGSHTLAFVGVNPNGGDNTALIDQVQVMASGPAFADPGFEGPAVGAGAFRYDPSGSSWSFSGTAGLAGNGSGFTAGNPNAPQGTQVAFLQGYGSVSQEISLATTGDYTVSFGAAQRGIGNASLQTIAVEVDGGGVDTITPVGGSYATYTTAAFTVAAGAHTIAFVGLNPDGGDNTALLDQVALFPAP